MWVTLNIESEVEHFESTIHLEDSMYTTIKTVIAGFAVLEQVFNGYKWPKQPYWVLRGIFWFALLIGTSHLLGRYLDPYGHGLTVFDLSGWGIWGAPTALFFYEVLVYFVHRAQHRVDFLWRMHQWHHSSERIDIWSAVRTHPLELPIFHIVGLIRLHGRVQPIEGDFRRADHVPPPHPVHSTHQRENTALAGLHHCAS